MGTPLISVVMPTYNHEKFVEQAISSVLKQKNVDFEFLIEDDGSKDKTRDVIASVKDSRIRFYPNTVNRGACLVHNSLLSKARGEYIALVNSDDYWTCDDKLAVQLDTLKSNEKLGACFGRARFVDQNGSPIKKDSLPFGNVFDKENRQKEQWLRYFFDHGNCICHPTILIKKECYDLLGGYNNRLRQLPDYDMWIRLVKKYEIYIDEREFINFRVLPGENASSNTSANSIRILNEHLIIAESVLDGVDFEYFEEGFGDMLKGNLRSDIALEIEKMLLLLADNQWLGKPYKLVAMRRAFNILNDTECRNIMEKEYGLDDRWFQKIMGEIDVLKPKIIADISFHSSKIRHIIKKLLGK